MQLTLIALYYYVCQCYNSHLRWQVQRFSSNSLQGHITDEELLTIYLFCVAFQEKHKLKSIHRYMQQHWLSYFPHLPAYETFVNRLNRMADLFPVLVEQLLRDLTTQEEAANFLLLDSMPIVTCSHKRKAKVALDLVNKGFCATKDFHYWGVKLHLLARSRKKKLPLPDTVGITPASVHDLKAVRPVLATLEQETIFADKAYCDEKLNQSLFFEQDCELITPLKLKKGTPQVLKESDQAYKDLFSRAVSSIRQPIESFFNWLQEKTRIQLASKVRSSAGLIVHIYGKLAAALYLWLIL